MKNLFVLSLFLWVGCIGRTQNITKKELNDVSQKVAKVLGRDWFLNQTENGFNVYFCRSCQDNYEAYLDSSNARKIKQRTDFFSLHDLDSVNYYPTVSNVLRNSTLSDSLLHLEIIKDYTPENILMFEIRFDKKWTKAHYDSIYQKNDQLKSAILATPIYKSSESIFSDYRFWLPTDDWKSRTTAYDFYFERLPYSSVTLPYSIFIIPDKPFFFSRITYVDKKDPYFYKKIANDLEAERSRTLKIIALAIGIIDYKLVN